MCLNYCLKILLAWFGIKFDPLILNKKSAEKNVSIIFALQKKYEFYWIRKKSLPKKHQKLLDGRDFRFTSFWGEWVQTSIEIIPNSLSKWFVQGALDRFRSDGCDGGTVYLLRDLYLYLDILLSYPLGVATSQHASGK